MRQTMRTVQLSWTNRQMAPIPGLGTMVVIRDPQMMPVIRIPTTATGLVTRDLVTRDLVTRDLVTRDLVTRDLVMTGVLILVSRCRQLAGCRFRIRGLMWEHR